MADDVLGHFGEKKNSEGYYADRVKFSLRNNDPYSARALLSYALEGAAKTDAERQMLSNYQAEVAALDEMQTRLSGVRGEIKEISFSKGPRDTARFSELKSEATRLANNITTADKRLLRLEASAPLRAVVESEKQAARRRERALTQNA